MSAKIFRDPLYNYVSVDRARDGWLLKLLDTPEVQRLRRIHQLGVSYLTYPGADHNRLAHSLGVLHLMQQALDHLEQRHKDEQINRARAPLLAAALLHDVGHGPFSHLFEPCLDIDHEVWSEKVLLDPSTKVHQILKGVDRTLPQSVAELINKDNHDHPAWQKALLSSQLDMDRLDYLRRDSLFTGAGYGHFDWFRILNTFELIDADGNRDIVWDGKSMLAIEEYIFARYYMYQNVYLHKTTRGFEKLVVAMWARAKELRQAGGDVMLVGPIADFWSAKDPAVQQYLRIEEFTVLQQIQNWMDHPDKPLSDLARRFLFRDRLAVVEPPTRRNELLSDFTAFETELHALLKRRNYDPPLCYCLRDSVKAKYRQPYSPEKESDEQSVKNAIRLRVPDRPEPVEISSILDRLKALTQEPTDRVRYYVPKDVQDDARRLSADFR